MTEPVSQREARDRALASRKALGAGEISRRSGVVVDRFLELSESSGLGQRSWSGLRVALYQAIPSELDLTSLEQKLARFGARLFFPRMTKGTEGLSREIEFAEMPPAEAAWQEGPYGIREPHRDLPAAAPSGLDLIFVPGSAYGTNGERVGMGRGYYDRFLSRLPGLIRIALAFDFQLFERITMNPWDQPVDWIVTETRELRSERTKSRLQVS